MTSSTWVIRTSADTNGAHHTPITPFQAQGSQHVASMVDMATQLG